MSELPPGTQFGPYRVLRPLGVGGMGAVYAALAPNGAEVALKVLAPGGSTEEAVRFQREAEAHARVDAHPAVARVHSAGVLYGRAFLVMDLLPGGDLEDRLRRGPLPPEEARALGVALADGLAHIHAQGVLHRDIKPANVLFDEQGRPRLTDFGIARPVEATSLTQSGVLLGTPGFMAPEQSGVGRPSTASDVFGLGATLYAALTGSPPFVGRTTLETLTKLMTEPPPPLPATLPANLRAAVMRALEKEPPSRFPSAAAFRDALQGSASSADSSSHRSLLAALALGVLLIAAALFLALPAGTEPSSAIPVPTATSPTPTPTPTQSSPPPARSPWSCTRPLVIDPEAKARPRSNAVLALWIDDRTFVTIAAGGAFMTWEPDARGRPRAAHRTQLPEAPFPTFPDALYRDGLLLWGSDDAPLNVLRLDEAGRPQGNPSQAPLVPHRVVPLAGGRYLLTSSELIGVWVPGEKTLRWSAKLKAPPGTEIVSTLYAIEERGRIEKGGELDVFLSWIERSDEKLANQAPSRLQGLRFTQEKSTPLWERPCPTRLRAFMPWRGGLLFGDNMGQVLKSGLDLEERQSLGLAGKSVAGLRQSAHRGPIRAVVEGLKGTLITLGAHQPELCIWNPDTGLPLRSYDFRAKKLLIRGNFLSLSPDRRCALVVGRTRVALVSVVPPE